MSQELGFVEVVVIATGEKVLVPPHWMEDKVLAAPFKFPPSVRAKMGEEGEADAGDPPPEGDVEDPTADPAGDPPVDPTPAPAPTTKARGSKP